MSDTKRKIGRPTKYNGAMIEDICEKIANGRSLRSICAEDGMPTTSTVCKWLIENKEFSEQYARAREKQADYFAEEIIEIADSAEAESAAVSKAKLQIDARKWAASKIAPKKYGDKQEIDVKSSDGSMRPTVRLNAEEFREIAEDVLNKV
nr:MAG TPA: terminase small subunit [Caudoviricetes sp.]